MLNDRVFDFWSDLILNSRRAEAERDFESFVIYHKGIISLIRELGVSEEICSEIWEFIIDIGNEFFSEYEETNSSK